LLAVAPRIAFGLSADELPDVGIETAKLLLHREKRLRVCNRCVNLEPIAHDAGILEQRARLALSVFRDLARVEAIVCGPVFVALAQDRVPAQSSLRPF